MMHRMQAVPLNYPSQSGKCAETPVFITKRVHGGHLADEARYTKHIPLTGVEWGESARIYARHIRQLGALRVVGAVESHIDR